MISAGRCPPFFRRRSPRFVDAKVAIAFVAPGIDDAIGDGILNGAVGFVGMSAVGKLASAFERSEFRIESGKFVGRDIPQLELANAWRVDDEPAERKGPKLGRRRCVSPLL